MIEIKKRFEFIRTVAYRMKHIDLWWKFINGDDEILTQIEELRQKDMNAEGRLL